MGGCGENASTKTGKGRGEMAGGTGGQWKGEGEL